MKNRHRSVKVLRRGDLARLTGCNLETIRYYENIEGGHAGAADNAQTAFRAALVYEFLLRTLCEEPS